MTLDQTHPANARVIAHLLEGPRHGTSAPPIARPSSHADPYMKAGAHPDIVQRVWDELGQALPADCRALVYGVPALVHPTAGVILALSYGTAYILRVPEDTVSEALRAGCTMERRWSTGATMRLDETLGPGWVFGNWAKDEAVWLNDVYHPLTGDL
jgi:hypothetical protein